MYHSKIKKFFSVVLTCLLSNVSQAITLGPVVVKADNLKWFAVKDLPPGAEVATVFGDPTRHAYFIVRIKLPANYSIPRHTHPINEHDTILLGKLYFKVGSKSGSLAAGDFIEFPANVAHATWTKEETIIQINGVGPWKVVYK